MTIDKINFIEKKVASVSETNLNRKFRLFSILTGVILLVSTIIVLSIDIFSAQKLNRVIDDQNNLIASLGTAENKKKETLFFLIKDRLMQIKNTEKSKVKEYEKLSHLKDISQVLTVKDFSLKGNVCTLTVETSDYRKIEDLLKNFDTYDIALQNATVAQTSFIDQKYKFTIKFNFM